MVDPAQQGHVRSARGQQEQEAERGRRGPRGPAGGVPHRDGRLIHPPHLPRTCQKKKKEARKTKAKKKKNFF